MKKLLLAAVTVAGLLFGSAAAAPAAEKENPAHAWFSDAKFGLFVHFGPYALLGRGEWVLNNDGIKADEYVKLQKVFNPQDFDAKQWVSLAKEAGMKYITFTSRHHDSFSNWDTKQSDWNIMNTHYGKDLVKQLADECHAQGVKLVLYYSLADWVRTDYAYATARTGKKTGRTEQGEWLDYIAFMKAQLTELLTNYGEIAGIWFDGEWDQMDAVPAPKSHDESRVDWHYREIYDLIHELQPNCMISNNHHLDPLPGENYQAFERDLPGRNEEGYSANQEVSRLPLETCQTMNKTWGYDIKDDNWKSTKQLIHLLVNANGYGANLLLNVGPMANGEFPEESVKRLKEMGEWTSKYGHTIYGTRAGVVEPQPWGATTSKGKTHYIHVYNAPEGGKITIAFPSAVKSAKWLNVDTKLVWKRKGNEATFDITAPLDDIDSIIEVVVK